MSLLDEFLMVFQSDGLKELPNAAEKAENALDDLEEKAEDAEDKVKKLDDSALKAIKSIKNLATTAARTIAPFVLLGKAIHQTMDFASQAIEVAEAAQKAGMTLEQFQLQEGNKYAIFTRDDVNNAKEYEMVMRDIRMGTMSIGAEISRMILPALTALLKIVRNVVDFFVDHGAFIKAVFIGLAVAVTAFAIPAIVNLGKTLLGLVLANPILLAISAAILAIALVVEDLYKWIHGEPSIAELLFGDFETFKTNFINGWNNIVSTLKGAFTSIGEFIKSLIDKIPDWLKFFIKNGGVYGLAFKGIGALAKNAINGSHADGLDYVPYDGYIAELHKGERVQTADEAQSWRSGLLAAKKAVDFTSSFPLNSIPQGAVSNAYNNSNASKTINIGDITIQTQATDAQGIAIDLAQYIKQAVIALDDGMIA